MTLYINTLYIVETRKDAEDFNAARDYCSEIYAPEYAIPYGAIPHGFRYENVIITYAGPRNSKYENEIAKNVRKDIDRGFTD